MKNRVIHQRNNAPTRLRSICGSIVLALSAGAASGQSLYLDLPQPPKIPTRVFKLTEYGGVGDGKTLNTAAFAKAIDACKKAGGGTLLVPKGKFVTGPLKLVSHMALYLDRGAVIQASSNCADFGLPDPLPPSQAELDAAHASVHALISGSQLTDIAIRGEGTIDGFGVVWWAMTEKAPDWALPYAPAAATAQPSASASPSPAARLIVDRPNMIVLRDCERVHIASVTFLNPPKFHFVPASCREVLVENVNIIAPTDSPNTDGIDPSNSSRILIRHCTIDTGDDNIALKAGPGGGIPTENVTVTDCTFKHGHGVSIGSETDSGVRNFLVQKCSFENTDNGLRIKSDRKRGGAVENVTYRDIVMKNVGIPITIFLFYSEKQAAVSPQFVAPTHTTPVLRDIHYLNVTCHGATKKAGEIAGLPESPVTGVTFQNVRISNVAGPFTLRDAKNLDLNGLDVTTAP